MKTREEIWGFRNRSALAAQGKYWVADECLACGLCREIAPELFGYEEEGARSYVKRQPETPGEVRLMEEAVEGCCTESILSDGDAYDWGRYAPLPPWDSLTPLQKWVREKITAWMRGRKGPSPEK